MTSKIEPALVKKSPDRFKHDQDVLFAVQTVITKIGLGEPFLLQEGDHFHLAIAIDGITENALHDFKNLIVGRSPLLILSSERGDAMGFDPENPISMPLSAIDNAESLYNLAASHPAKVSRRPILEQPEARFVLDLLIKAKRLPACLIYTDIHPVNPTIKDVFSIKTEDIKAYEQAKVASLKRKSEAPIPVRGGINTRMVVFQYATGDNEIALIVGKPDLSKPLAIRIHSACATGDIFGSERCDCGDQLRLAIEKLDEMDGGAIIYLDQEGRGIGLVNKIRAYDLQDQSLDTVDANRTLGFSDDMRRYHVAAAMVRALGWQDVSILTNNPKKVKAISEHGLNVIKRISHQAPMNENNSNYLKTKARRSGHMLTYK